MVFACRQGFDNTVQLTCVMRPGTDQMLVHVMEANSFGKVKTMGLSVNKYVPDSSRLQQRTWQGPHCNTYSDTSGKTYLVVKPPLSEY